MDGLFRQVNLTIDHNWAVTKQLVEKLLKLESHSSPEAYGDSDHYSLNSLGTISRHKASKSWYRVAGHTVNHTMPWLARMLELMKELDPDDGCISKSVGNGARHVDFPQMRAAVNYIFDNTDENAYTNVISDHGEFRYPSVVNTSWILNTQIPHEIISNGIRWTLSIHFDADYEQVQQWFERNDNLVFR